MALLAVVVTEVGVVAVVVESFVGQVVALVVGHQVGHGEAVVASNEVDAGLRAAPCVFEQFRRAV